MESQNPFSGLPTPEKDPWARGAARPRTVAIALVIWYLAGFGLCLAGPSAGSYGDPLRNVLGVLATATLVGPPLLALLGTGMGVVWMLRARGKGVSQDLWWQAQLGTLVNGVFFLFGAGLLFLSTLTFSRGRQLRVLGRVLLPPVVKGDDWICRQTSLAAVPAALREPLARQWRENGRTEHASIAAFARLTQDLMVLGAPPSILADAQRDALEEIQHTQACFSLATALDGREEGPGPFPASRWALGLLPIRGLALCQLAVDSLVDGALHEGLSARVVATLSLRCEIPEIQAVLRQIAADEARHAQHGWEVVEWCLQEGGLPVAVALEGALWMMAEHFRSELPAAARDGSWEPYGIHGEATEEVAYQKVREGLLARFAGLRALAA